ncbi:MAG TPA: hypothetical protein VMU14_13680 [Acidimicrobiales bacterium]|nr:hypothetical protein [Acidimicrobiales bacterium]
MSTPSRPPEPRRQLVTPARVALVVVVVLAIVFAAENTRRTRIRFIVPIVSTWVWLALLVALVLGFAAGLLVGRRRK